MTRVQVRGVGSIGAIWRYPVKSMRGEELDAGKVTEHGLVGDRAYALLDATSAAIASAANPRKWAALYGCRASYEEQPHSNQPLAPVRMTLPNGEIVTSTQRDCDVVLTRTLGRAVTLVTNPPATARFEMYWPDIAGVVPVGDPVPNADHEHITALPVAFAAPMGTFFDFAVIHLLTTATLGRLHELYPQGRFDPHRFRPNLVVDTGTDEVGFVENHWVGCTLAIGDEVRLRVLVPCPRCVRTTLAQGDLPKDSGILRVVAQHNQVPVGDFGRMGCAGVYCDVVRTGLIRRGDTCWLE
jgi:uncharacterized protein YcbX